MSRPCHTKHMQVSHNASGITWPADKRLTTYIHCSQPDGMDTTPPASTTESKEHADRSGNKVSMLTSSRRQSEADNCGF